MNITLARNFIFDSHTIIKKGKMMLMERMITTDQFYSYSYMIE